MWPLTQLSEEQDSAGSGLGSHDLGLSWGDPCSPSKAAHGPPHWREVQGWEDHADPQRRVDQSEERPPGRQPQAQPEECQSCMGGEGVVSVFSKTLKEAQKLLGGPSWGLGSAWACGCFHDCLLAVEIARRTYLVLCKHRRKIKKPVLHHEAINHRRAFVQTQELS